jgi:hypothetical protein
VKQKKIKNDRKVKKNVRQKIVIIVQLQKSKPKSIKKSKEKIFKRKFS